MFFVVKMLVDIIFILFILMVIVFLFEGKYFLMIKSEIGVFCILFLVYYLIRYVFNLRVMFNNYDFSLCKMFI